MNKSMLFMAVSLICSTYASAATLKANANDFPASMNVNLVVHHMSGRMGDSIHPNQETTIKTPLPIYTGKEGDIVLNYVDVEGYQHAVQCGLGGLEQTRNQDVRIDIKYDSKSMRFTCHLAS